MPQTIQVVDGPTPVSLYFDLKKGSSASLDVVAEASLAWSSSLRALLAAVEPGLELEIEIVDGDEGSLWLNTIFKFIETGLTRIEAGGEKYPRLWALARGLAFIVVATPIAVTAEDVWRWLVADEPQIEQLSPETKQELMRDFESLLQKKVAENQKRKFFQSIERDTTITGIGLAGEPNEQGATITHRERYVSYLEDSGKTEQIGLTRKRTEKLDVMLVSPVLRNAERSWKFMVPGMPEFGAVMKDKGFLDALARGDVHIEMREGIPMVIQIEFKEHMEGAVWVTDERNVVEVISPQFDRNDLFGGPSG